MKKINKPPKSEMSGAEDAQGRKKETQDLIAKERVTVLREKLQEAMGEGRTLSFNEKYLAGMLTKTPGFAREVAGSIVESALVSSIGERGTVKTFMEMEPAVPVMVQYAQEAGLERPQLEDRLSDFIGKDEAGLAMDKYWEA